MIYWILMSEQSIGFDLRNYHPPKRRRRSVKYQLHIVLVSLFSKYKHQHVHVVERERVALEVEDKPFFAP